MQSPHRFLVRVLPIFTFLLAASCGGSSGGHAAGPDTQPPSFGGARVATGITDTAIIIQWDAATDDRNPPGLIVYNIYMATTSGGEDYQAPLATTLSGALLFRVNGLAPSTDYYFVVRAEDTSGNEDANIVEVFATTPALPDTLGPSFGGATFAAATSESTIDVFWNQGTDDLTPQDLIVYNVYFALASGAQNFLTPDLSSPPGATSATIGGLQPTTDVYIVVRAEDAVGNEETNTQEVSATTWTPDTTPPIFGGLQQAIPQNPTKVDLSWNAASDDRAQPSEILYNIYWSTVSGGQNFGNPSGSSQPGALTYTAMGLNPGTDYFFVVRARDPSGNEETNTIERPTTTLVSFNAQVLGIFTSNCTVSGCHGQSTPASGMDLTSYSAVTNTAINIASIQAPTMVRIQPRSSGGSYLQHKIDGTHNSVGGSGDRMPRPPSPALSLADRDTIRAWINQGATGN